MATQSSTLAWKILWMEEPGRLWSMGSLRVGHDWATSLSRFTFMHWRRKWQPTPVFLPGESQGRGSIVGCYLGVTQSQTQLKWLSSSSSNRGIKKIFFNLKNDNSKNIFRTFSGVVVDSVGSVHFQIVPWSSLHFSRSIGPFLCSWC